MCRIDRLAVAAEVLENPLNRCLLLDARDHPELPAAAPAGLDVDGNDTFEALRPGRRFFALLSYETNDIDLPKGNFITRLAPYRTEVVFSPKLSWVTLIQYDNLSEIVGLNCRIHWFPQPGREAFLVLNHNAQDLDRDNSFESIGADVSIKYSYTFWF